MSYLVIFILLSISSIIYIKVADKYNIIDTPNKRSSHIVPVIRGGGILFVVSLMLFYCYTAQYLYFFVGTMIISIVSFIDDLMTLPSRVRFPFQLIAVVLCLYQIYGMEISLINYLVFIIIGIGTINFYNFMDGINGLTGLYTMVVLIFLMFLNYKENIINHDFYYFQLIALVVFGYYNFRSKARFFAGDIGSISLAMIVFFSLMSSIRTLNAPVLLMFLGVYGADTLTTFFYRLLILKENVAKPHRHHIYQKAVDYGGFSHLKVAFIYSAIQLLISLLVFNSYDFSISSQWILVIVLVILLLLAYIWCFYFLKNKNNSIK